MTALSLLFSARSGMLAQRIGPKLPLTVGPLAMALGLGMLTALDPGDSYVASVLPAVTIFGLGLTLVAAPITATVLAGADDRHAGIASGVNNAVARVANLLAVAALPVIAGITGDSFYDPTEMTDGFHIAMIACAALAATGGVVAWLTIGADALEAEPRRRGRAPEPVPADFACSVAGPPLRSAAGFRPVSPESATATENRSV